MTTAITTAFDQNDFAAGLAAARLARLKPGITPPDREALAKTLLSAAEKAKNLNAWIESYHCAQEAYLTVNGLPKGAVRDDVLLKWKSIYATLHSMQFS